MYGLARPTAIERAQSLMDLFELRENRKLIAEYSKGMRKRVAMAASLIHHPELFLMDEPFEGVDAVGARLMKDILLDQVRRGATIFLTIARAGGGGAAVRPRGHHRRGQDRARRVAWTNCAADGIAGRRFRAPGGRRPRISRVGVAEMIRAILRAQWLSMRMFRLASGRRSAMFSGVVATLWYGFWMLLAVIAEEVAAAPGLRVQIETWLPAGLLAVFAYWQLAPMASATMGASLDLRKLMIYPVPRRSLFLVEILLRITTCAELLLLLTGVSIGLLRNPAFGGLRGAVRVPLAMILFAAFNLMLAAGLRNLLERLLNRKGIREVMGLLLMMLGVLPRLLMVTGAGGRRIERVLPTAANPIWPWGAAAHFMLASPAAYFYLSSAVLLTWTIAAYLFGRWQFARSLHYDLQEAQARTVSAKDRRFADRLYRLPAWVLPDPLAAIVEKELRSLARTPRFRMVFVMGFSFGLVVWLPMMLRGRVAHSAVSGSFLTIVSLYALFLLAQVTYGNAFGFDRSAAQLYYLAPVSIFPRDSRQERGGGHLHFSGGRGGGGGLHTVAAGNFARPNCGGVRGDSHRRAVSAERRQHELIQLSAADERAKSLRGRRRRARTRAAVSPVSVGDAAGISGVFGALRAR